MDGTLTVSNIDFVKMRQLVEIPVGDLFTVMESWDSGDRIFEAMQTILDLEAEACETLQAPSGCCVGLVTRNTTESVNAFFALVGEEWRSAFDILLTREHRYVKPDKRALLHFAQEWGLQPWQLLMVGDSIEDIETGERAERTCSCSLPPMQSFQGNAAGTASCLIAGGGNEVGAAQQAAQPLGAVPTFTVQSLGELRERLAARDTRLGHGAYGGADEAAASGSGSEGEGEGSPLAGAPPAGLGFLDFLFAQGALRAAACSFPRIVWRDEGGAVGGPPPDEHPGDRMLHLACGNGALTKLLFSSGLQVIGVDEDVAAARRRGLPAVQLAPLHLAAGALQPELSAVGGTFDVALLYCPPGDSGDVPLAGSWWQREALAEVRRALKPSGRLCVEAPGPAPAALRAALAAAGFEAAALEAAGPGRVRLVAIASA
eukprot:scaffold4.g4575.t1